MDDPGEAHAQIIEHIDTFYDYAWTLRAETKNGFIPVGFIFGIEANDFIYISHVRWCQWATPRNKLETALKFLSVIRRKHILIFLPHEPDRPFMERVMKYGMAHKSGQLLNKKEKHPIYQTRG